MRFTKPEIALMRNLGIKSNLEQPETISDDEWIEIEEQVGEYLQVYGLDKNYEPTQDGATCEDILGKLP